LDFTGCPNKCGVWARAPHQAQPEGKAVAPEASDHHMDSPYELDLVCRAPLGPLPTESSRPEVPREDTEMPVSARRGSVSIIAAFRLCFEELSHTT